MERPRFDSSTDAQGVSDTPSLRRSWRVGTCAARRLTASPRLACAAACLPTCRETYIRGQRRAKLCLVRLSLSRILIVT